MPACRPAKLRMIAGDITSGGAFQHRLDGMPTGGKGITLHNNRRLNIHTFGHICCNELFVGSCRVSVLSAIRGPANDGATGHTSCFASHPLRVHTLHTFHSLLTYMHSCCNVPHHTQVVKPRHMLPWLVDFSGKQHSANCTSHVRIMCSFSKLSPQSHPQQPDETHRPTQSTGLCDRWKK